MLTITARQEALKNVTLIEIDRDQVLIHDVIEGKDVVVTLILIPARYPGVSLADLQAQTENIARANNIPVRRRPRL